MAALFGIGISLLLFVVTVVISAVTKLPLVLPVVGLTALWAAWDSTRIGLQKYRSGIALHPVGIFVGVGFLWAVGFPWYLAARWRLKHGTLPLKTDPATPAERAIQG